MWKKFLLYLLSISFSLILLPALLVGNCWQWESSDSGNHLEEAQVGQLPSEVKGERILKIYHAEQKKVIELPLEEYIIGVIAAEMPASFHPEALKAQAVIARTYALAKAGRLGGGCTENPGADLCTDSRCCQAWEDRQTMAEKWTAEEAPLYLEKIGEAVQETRGMVLLYRGELAQTVYHSTCGGETEKAADAWKEGCDIPYLQNVKCSFCRHSPHYTAELYLDSAAYAAALRMETNVLPVLREDNIPLLEVVQKSSSGRNMLLKIGNGDGLYRGEEIRRLLGLPSTFFRWQAEGNRIIFFTRGYGHGVGLCQYGADGMAAQGFSFREILDFYYRGTEVQLRN